MAKETGWTLDYIDNGISVQDWHDYWQILDGEAKARPTTPARKGRRR
jgi:hypothetical protein